MSLTSRTTARNASTPPPAESNCSAAGAIITDIEDEIAGQLGTDKHAQLRTILDELTVITARLGTD